MHMSEFVKNYCVCTDILIYIGNIFLKQKRKIVSNVYFNSS